MDETDAGASIPDEELSVMDSLIRPYSSLSDLLLSPSVLSSESSLLTSELTSLCHASHSTFLLLHNTSSTLSSSIDTLSSSIDSLLGTLPSLTAATQNFTKATKPVLEERRKASLVLEQQEKLIDLLEIPALIDTCSRNGQYQDALDLSLHANNLWQSFRADDSNSAILRSLQSEVDGSVKLMLGGLIETLKGRAKLPVLYKSIGFLRSMGGWSEEDLAILFLCCRGALLSELHDANASSQGGKRDVTKYLRGYIDVFREGVQDTVTAYTNIFLKPAAPSQQQQTSTFSDLIEDLRFYLSIFANNQINALISTLSTNLPEIEDFTSLASLLTPLTYCGTSFARVGMDFRPLLARPFADAVLVNVKQSTESATTSFASLIADSEKNGLLPSQWLIAASPTQTASGHRVLPRVPSIPDSLAAEDDPHATPQILTFSPPLTILINGHLTTLNSLRSLPIVSLLPAIHDNLCSELASTIRAFVDYARASALPTSPTTRMSFERRNSEMMGTTGRPRSPNLQRTSSISGAAPSSPSTRPFSPTTPRQSFVLGEDAKAKQEAERGVIIAVGKALVCILAPFVIRALVVEVYASEEKDLDGAEGAKDLRGAIEDWEKWYEEWAPKVVNGGSA